MHRSGRPGGAEGVRLDLFWKALTKDRGGRSQFHAPWTLRSPRPAHQMAKFTMKNTPESHPDPIILEEKGGQNDQNGGRERPALAPEVTQNSFCGEGAEKDPEGTHRLELPGAIWE